MRAALLRSLEDTTERSEYTLIYRSIRDALVDQGYSGTDVHTAALTITNALWNLNLLRCQQQRNSAESDGEARGEDDSF